MSESRTRRHFSPSQKAEVVRRHLAGKEAIKESRKNNLRESSAWVAGVERSEPPGFDGYGLEDWTPATQQS